MIACDIPWTDIYFQVHLHWEELGVDIQRDLGTFKDVHLVRRVRSHELEFYEDEEYFKWWNPAQCSAWETKQVWHGHGGFHTKGLESTAALLHKASLFLDEEARHEALAAVWMAAATLNLGPRHDSTEPNLHTIHMASVGRMHSLGFDNTWHHACKNGIPEPASHLIEDLSSKEPDDYMALRRWAILNAAAVAVLRNSGWQLVRILITTEQINNEE